MSLKILTPFAKTPNAMIFASSDLDPFLSMSIKHSLKHRFALYPDSEKHEIM